mmetsp:Transcript_36944/g.61244  ORF Transcript_36944/g.61244 Transcript_36944/m.61244 type:complete len:486 (-) Transcript_36944:439-1896(-)|eukprot:CAMPEP_0119317702 /NCGR_PEP_ID=MMETSP1333-20130426/43951_1 /TAXON_ID=418940 /ORGANISM="Scyphosphaera apsteinii, Strain RCC1455" /LENGTH=485 /DNA_ID=CAMNT_0007323713 /DNA_START=92 /DNA_END=1549 /DNA_ORIENTATION=-
MADLFHSKMESAKKEAAEAEAKAKEAQKRKQIGPTPIVTRQSMPTYEPMPATEKLIPHDSLPSDAFEAGCSTLTPNRPGWTKARNVLTTVQHMQRKAYRSPKGMVTRFKSKDANPPPFLQGSKLVLTGTPLNLLLVLVPLALAAGPLKWTSGVVFALCCGAILPLAGILGDATEQVAMHTNDTLGGLLNATFGNATELIVCVFALSRGLLQVVQVSLLGSILSNTLLVLGCACVAGGLRKMQCKFNVVAARSNTTLLQISILGLMVPTLLEKTGQMTLLGKVDLDISRGISGSLLLLYCFYIYFQLVTHATLFDPKNEDVEEDSEAEEERQILTLSGGLVWLGIATLLIAVLSESLTGAIEGTAEELGLSRSFVGFVVIPIVGNAAEHSTAIVMAHKGKMDLAFGVALGSSTQIALFVVPLMVLLGWPMGQPLDLYFGLFETAVTFLSGLIVSLIVAGGETNWLEGVMLLFSYGLISFAFFFKTD